MASRPHGTHPHGPRTNDGAPHPEAGHGGDGGDGVSRRGRARLGRVRRTLIAAFVAASVAVPLSGAARPAAVAAPAPAALAPLSVGTLDARYETNRANVLAAEKMAEDHQDRRRARALSAMADPARHFLSFDGRAGGRTAEVFGDLARAETIAVLVPGSDTSLDQYGRLLDGARALAGQLGPRAAVIAWMGYETPGTVSPEILTPGRADDAAPQLTAFMRELAAAKPTARTSLVCHSYGSVVCAKAASGVEAADIVLYGSPGTGFDTASALHTSATVWAGRAGGDWIADVPHTSLHLPFVTVGFGSDPVSRHFGARHFDAGPGGHSDYLRPGSVPLKNIARIVNGQRPQEDRHA
ncbi:alpha/beta hydrolase [Streptomyces sp. NPDC006692]|uniref:alpha/beta hydrolase n=1 Tax=Streptomyces sp. NPDC006692 TaxID=3364758 RepID=UPI00368BF587